MKLILSIALLAFQLPSIAQTQIEKTIPIAVGQKLLMNFDDPTIKIQTWDKKEILIKGTVSINNGENDSAFNLEVTTTAQEITITSLLKDKEHIPGCIVIKKNDKEYFFKTSNMNDPEIQKFFNENGRDYSYLTTGIIKNIKLEIFVPKNIDTKISAKYGLIEVKNFSAPLTVDSKYGGVDASIVPITTGEITARSRHGEILTNLDVTFDQAPFDKKDKWTKVTAKAGNGPRYNFESKFGNIYLRKSN